MAPDKDKKMIILGHNVVLSAIRNPHIRRAIRERMNQFVFNYGDHKDHTEKCKPSYSDYKDYRDKYDDTNHTDHRDYSQHNDYDDEWYEREGGGYNDRWKF